MHSLENQLLELNHGAPALIRMGFSYIYKLLCCYISYTLRAHIPPCLCLLAPMAFPKLITAVLFTAVALARIQLSACHVVKGKVSCLDCKHNDDAFSGLSSFLSPMIYLHKVLKAVVMQVDKMYFLFIFFVAGIMVLVKCDGVKKLATAATEDDGSFEVELPSGGASKTSPRPSVKCYAKLLGGPTQLYVSRKDAVSKIIETHKPASSFTISTPLSFSTSCPTTKEFEKWRATNKFASSKNFDLPLPPEWGLAPSSYYIPYYPIITGIPWFSPLVVYMQSLHAGEKMLLYISVCVLLCEHCNQL